jgi:TM2 domain-containing membrane protein YozV
MSRPDPTVAALLEAVPGFFFQTFGIGHLYQGRLGMGLFIMLSYWTLQVINALLCLILVGFVTAPLTFVLYMIAAPLNALDDQGGRSRGLLAG